MPPKRKAKEIQNELPSVEPRRSRRRTSEVKPEAAAEKPDPVTKVKLPKKSKKPANTVAVDTKGEGEKDAIEEAVGQIHYLIVSANSHRRYRASSLAAVSRPSDW